VLDFACGHGQLAGLCDPERYIGYDIDARRIAVARESFPNHIFDTTLPSGERFDSVVALAFIEHVQPAPYLRQFRDLLEPAGRIVISTPHPAFEWVHTLGGKMQLFSREAHEEHVGLLSPRQIDNMAKDVSLTLTERKSFLLGANQLFVLQVA
jgi:SAM-dependent methyltransferase